MGSTNIPIMMTLSRCAFQENETRLEIAGLEEFRRVACDAAFSTLSRASCLLSSSLLGRSSRTRHGILNVVNGHLGRTAAVLSRAGSDQLVQEGAVAGLGRARQGTLGRARGHGAERSDKVRGKHLDE